MVKSVEAHVWLSLELRSEPILKMRRCTAQGDYAKQNSTSVRQRVRAHPSLDLQMAGKWQCTPRRRTAQCAYAEGRRSDSALLPSCLTTCDTAGKRQCTPSDTQCTAVVSSRKSSRPGRALAPSCPSTWTRQASANAQ